MLGKLNWFHLTSPKTMVLLMEKWMSLFLRKSHLIMLGLIFSSKFDEGSYIISIARTSSKEIGTLIRSLKFLSSEVVLYLYKSTIHPFMENFYHVWAGALRCYLEL